MDKNVSWSRFYSLYTRAGGQQWLHAVAGGILSPRSDIFMSIYAHFKLQVRLGGEGIWNIANITDVNLKSICSWAYSSLLSCYVECVTVQWLRVGGGQGDGCNRCRRGGGRGRDVVLAGASVPRAEWPCHNNYTSEGGSVPWLPPDVLMLSLFIAH